MILAEKSHHIILPHAGQVMHEFSALVAES
jgi:hypothetical protein